MPDKQYRDWINAFPCDKLTEFGTLANYVFVNRSAYINPLSDRRPVRKCPN